MPPGRVGEYMAVEQLVLLKECRDTWHIPFLYVVTWAKTRWPNVSYNGSIGQLYTEMLLSTAGYVDHARKLLNIIYNQHHSFSSLLLILHLRELQWILSDLSLIVGHKNSTYWYFSRKLLPREEAYSTVEKELSCHKTWNWSIQGVPTWETIWDPYWP